MNAKLQQSDESTLGLVLTGGGARAAYQVGVLKGIAEQLSRGSGSPFQVVTGTSAGAPAAVRSRPARSAGARAAVRSRPATSTDSSAAVQSGQEDFPRAYLVRG